MYEGMRKHLRRCKYDSSLPGALRSATEAASEKLELYYSKACGSQLNTIATLLHPSLGMAWFRKMESDPASSTELSAARAKILFEHAYELYSQIHGAKSTTPAAAVERARPGTLGSFLEDICMVDVANTTEAEVVVPEIQRFWDAFKGHAGDPNNPLKWWKAHFANSVSPTF
ncbi:hypothetical protein FB451DRAFT_1557286 [Mycena latifolia]|nr:hypothetical protein FB451DRAFT_1557286 [Mycena latifolia]